MTWDFCCTELQRPTGLEIGISSNLQIYSTQRNKPRSSKRTQRPLRTLKPTTIAVASLRDDQESLLPLLADPRTTTSPPLTAGGPTQKKTEQDVFKFAPPNTKLFSDVEDMNNDQLALIDPIKNIFERNLPASELIRNVRTTLQIEFSPLLKLNMIRTSTRAFLITSLPRTYSSPNIFGSSVQLRIIAAIFYDPTVLAKPFVFY